MSQHVVSKNLYYAVFAILIVLTVVTVSVATLDLGLLNIVIAISIASFKALLVVLYFMQVRYSSRLIWVFVGAGFFWLVLLIGGTAADYLTRELVSGPGF